MAGAQHVSLAVDLGASSGRVVAGLFDGSKLELSEVHRFENGGIRASDRLQWDVLGLWQSIQDGMREAQRKFGDRAESIGVDTWGVDFGLLGSDELLLGNPLHYRDAHTDGVLEQAFAKVSRKEIFAATGLQFMPFNTLFQFFAMRRDGSSALEAAKHFLMMPDLFHWLMTGEKVNEQTNASTTQFYNPQSANWATDLLERFGLPSDILGEIALPGTVVGGLRSSVADATGLTNLKVVLPGTHDTASAVMAVPATASDHPDWCYISSGTWSLMGIETPQPIVTDQVCELNFTNEGGVGGTTRLLKNIAGLWLIQECRRIWELEGKSYSFSDIVDLAAEAEPRKSLIEPDHPDFMAPAHMPNAIVDYCRRTNQTIPETRGSIVRCALESLALRYRSVLNSLQNISGHPIETIHIVGGGTQNELLCQMAADACNKVVVAGPVEATAIGNSLMQLIAMGHVGSIAEARAIIQHSFPVKRYEPQQHAEWADAIARFEALSSD